MAAGTTELARETDFLAWLKKVTALGKRPQRDILSRARRVGGMIDLQSAATPEDLEVMLLRSADFKACTPSVKSQLRRAAKLYIRFRSETQA